MIRATSPFTRHGAWAVVALCGLGWGAQAAGQDASRPEQDKGNARTPPLGDEGIEVSSPYEGRPIHAVRLVGLSRVTEQLARNQLRVAAGQPLEWNLVREDARRLQRLGEFRGVKASVDVMPDLSVDVVYTLVEAPVVKDVQVVGNRQVSDEQIITVTSEVVSLLTGVPIDDYRVAQGQRAIENLYHEKGYYQAQVTVDESELETRGVVQYRVREGPRTRVSVINFDGATAFEPKVLRQQVKTETFNWFATAPLDDEVLDNDVAALAKWYRDHGYLDVRVSRRVQPSPDSKEAIVTFVISEGRVYTLRRVFFQARAKSEEEPGKLEVFSPEQLTALFEIKPGDVVSAKGVDAAVKGIKDAYLKLGYVDATVGFEQLRQGDDPLVDLRMTIGEGQRFRTGLVTINGNELTQSKVPRRYITIRPDRWLDGTEAAITEKRIKDSNLFELNPLNGKPPKLTIQPENPEDPGRRDVLVEVNETDTGNLSFGAAVSSDSGLFGVVNLNQRNFDLDDTPDSFEEFITGKAFRGAGQTFNLSLQPGLQQSNYSLSITEPWLFESPYSLTVAGLFTQRDYNEYDEDRLGGRVRLARRFGERWVGGVSVRAQNVNIHGINADSTNEVFDVKGDNFITGVGLDLTRSTLDNRIRPTEGTNTELAVEEVGALGGDFHFTKLSALHSIYIPIDEDYLDRKTVLSLNTRVYDIIPDNNTPIFERYFMGGRSFRGFKYRGIGPTGLHHNTQTPSGDHVGGDFSFFLGAEVEKPVFEKLISVVFFTDTGTLNQDVSLDNYRVSIGTGVRLYIPQFGQAPLAFDVAVPLKDEGSDHHQIFSFALDIPF